MPRVFILSLLALSYLQFRALLRRVISGSRRRLTNLLFSNDVQCPPPKKASYSVSCSFHERVARRLTFFGERPRGPRCLRKLQIKSVVPQFSLHACVHEHVFFGVVGTPYLSKLLFQGCHENWLAFFCF